MDHKKGSRQMNYLGTDATAGPLPTRPLGSTGAEVPIVGFGAIAILSPSIVDAADPQAAANDCVKQAVEAGFTYFDIGPAYGGGRAEALLGPALVPFRERCFIAQKTLKRDGAEATAELEASLKTMQTDHFGASPQTPAAPTAPRCS